MYLFFKHFVTLGNSAVFLSASEQRAEVLSVHRAVRSQTAAAAYRRAMVSEDIRYLGIIINFISQTIIESLV